MKADRPIFDKLDEHDKGVAMRNALRANAELASGKPLSALSDDALMSYIIMREYDLAVALAEAAKRGPAAVVLN